MSEPPKEKQVNAKSVQGESNMTGEVDPPEEVPVPALKEPMAWNSFKTMGALLLEEEEEEEDDEPEKEERVEELIHEIGQLESKEEHEELHQLMAEFGAEPMDHEEMSEFYAKIGSLDLGDGLRPPIKQDSMALLMAEEGLDPHRLPPKTADGRPEVAFQEVDEDGRDSQEDAPAVSGSKPPVEGAEDQNGVPSDGKRKKTVRISTKPLNICMMVVGTYGDVLPFLAIGDILAKDGHCIRVATHECFRAKIEERGFNFFCLGADPLLLSEFMVKHKSLLISNPLKAIPALSDLGPQMRLAKEILARSWPAVCSNKFRADAILANPPAWGHVHVAERLKVPLHIMFPQPWLPTRDFPHVFSGWDFSKPPRDKNRSSYKIMDAMMYLPLHFPINKFRNKLGLRPINLSEGMSGLLRKRPIPFSFIWSEAIVPFPKDWPRDRADIVGCIHITPEDYTPSPELAKFLRGGDPPILITFGSMRIQSASGLARKIYNAARKAKVRVLVQSGWSDLEKPMKKSPLICHIKAAPHTWLIPLTSAVVHHGGAGTTHAAALYGKPQQVCPFFGDQPFWGNAIFRTGAALKPVPIDDLREETLAMAFNKLSTSKSMKAAAGALASKLAKEDGATQAVKSFWRHYRRFKQVQSSRRSALRRSSRVSSALSISKGGMQRRGSAAPRRASMHSAGGSRLVLDADGNDILGMARGSVQFRDPHASGGTGAASPRGRSPATRTRSPRARSPVGAPPKSPGRRRRGARKEAEETADGGGGGGGEEATAAEAEALSGTKRSNGLGGTMSDTKKSELRRAKARSRSVRFLDKTAAAKAEEEEEAALASSADTAIAEPAARKPAGSKGKSKGAAGDAGLARDDAAPPASRALVVVARSGKGKKDGSAAAAGGGKAKEGKGIKFDAAVPKDELDSYNSASSDASKASTVKGSRRGKSGLEKYVAEAKEAPEDPARVKLPDIRKGSTKR